MDFKDMVIDDLDTVFFDMDEFAETHNIDGKDIDVVLTTTTFKSAKMTYGLMKSTLNPKETAINKSGYLLYIRDKDARERYTVNAMIKLDGVTMFVQNVEHTKGVWQLKIGKHQL